MVSDGASGKGRCILFDPAAGDHEIRKKRFLSYIVPVLRPGIPFKLL